MTALPEGYLLRALQTHLARVEAVYPDWDSKLLKFNLRYARTFQMKCESQPRRHAGLLELPEYQEAARRIWQLQQEYHLWLSRCAGCHRSDDFDQLTQHYLNTRRNLRHSVLYVEHFQSRTPRLLASLIQPGFQGHEVAYPGLGYPDQWTYIEGLNRTKVELGSAIQAAQQRLTLG